MEIVWVYELKKKTKLIKPLNTTRNNSRVNRFI